MKFISWNVNGIRACLNKGFMDFFNEVDADFFCIQESKCQMGQVELHIEGYYQYWNYAHKKGYSGTAIFTKHKPIHVKYGVGEMEIEEEGRIITLEYEQFYLVNVYTPNAKRDLSRLPYRIEWEEKLKSYLMLLDSEKPVIYCGDLNVAYSDIDLKNAKSNQGNSGVTVEERGAMKALLESGFVDTFRHFYPNRTDIYTWWSYMAKVRERNIGWRIDYFIVSERFVPSLESATIHDHVLGSDHCPIELEIKL